MSFPSFQSEESFSLYPYDVGQVAILCQAYRSSLLTGTIPRSIRITSRPLFNRTSKPSRLTLGSRFHRSLFMHNRTTGKKKRKVRNWRLIYLIRRNSLLRFKSGFAGIFVTKLIYIVRLVTMMDNKLKYFYDFCICRIFCPRFPTIINDNLISLKLLLLMKCLVLMKFSRWWQIYTWISIYLIELTEISIFVEMKSLRITNISIIVYAFVHNMIHISLRHWHFMSQTNKLYIRDHFGKHELRV